MTDGSAPHVRPFGPRCRSGHPESRGTRRTRLDDDTFMYVKSGEDFYAKVYWSETLRTIGRKVDERSDGTHDREGR